MTIQKSRLAALITVMLVFSIMISLLVVPASAATYDFVIPQLANFTRADMAAVVLESQKVKLQGAKDYKELATLLEYDNKDTIAYCLKDSNTILIQTSKVNSVLDKYNSTYGTNHQVAAGEYFDGRNLFTPFKVSSIPWNIKESSTQTFTLSVDNEISFVAQSVNFTSILDTIVELLPIVLVVIIGFIGLRKGIHTTIF